MFCMQEKEESCMYLYNHMQHQQAENTGLYYFDDTDCRFQIEDNLYQLAFSPFLLC